MDTFHDTDNYGGIMEIELYEASNSLEGEVTTSSLVAGDVYAETTHTAFLNVGRGVLGDAPSYPLDVLSSGTAARFTTNNAHTYCLINTNSSGKEAIWRFLDNGVTKWSLGKKTNNVFGLYNHATSSWAYEMSAAGNATFTGTITESSSIAIKENIFDLNTTLDKINRVRPVKYNKKVSKDKKEIGLIAEELAEIFPELVENDENGNPTSVNYTRAVTVLFDGFKQMYKELKEIKEKIK